MSYLKPDYRNCGLNVISSIAGYFGLQLGHPSLPLLDERLAKKHYQNVILMLFDGMGMDILSHALPEDAFLRQHVAAPISAVYPSTTTCATTAIECGLSPREHAWLGWTLYFPQIQKPVDIFINLSEGEPAAEYHVANRFIPRDFIFHRITEAGQAEACSVSPFGDVRVDSLDALFSTTLALAMDEKRRYIYTYWSDPDHTMHEKGCYHEKVLATVQDINNRLERFYAQLPPDTLLLLTADHGLIDGDFKYLEDTPELYQMLLHDTTIETRAVSFHVKPECKAAFPAAFEKIFGGHFLLMTRDEFIRDYLGDGEIRPQVYDFVGDYMALAIDATCIGNRRSEHELKGVHAGLTPREMLVPLMIAEN